MCARALVFCGLTLLACADPRSGSDPKVPGDYLGTFAIVGHLVRDECGAELLGASDPWQFEVKLSRFEQDLYWLNGREAVVGDIAADGSTFRFSTRVDRTVSPSRGAAAGCTVSRLDEASGTLAQPASSPDGIQLDLSYTYRSKNGADCVEIIGIPGGVQQLPCRLTYHLIGARVD